MDKIDRLKQLLLTHRTENISKLTFEERLKFDDSFAEEIVKLFAIPDVVGRSEQLFCPHCEGTDTQENFYTDTYGCNSCGHSWAK